MVYNNYTIGGELYHSEKGSSIKARVYKYIDKVLTKSGKWRYIYNTKITGKAYKHEAEHDRERARKYKDDENVALARLKTRKAKYYDKYLDERDIYRLETMLKSGNTDAVRAAKGVYKSGKYYFNRDEPKEKQHLYEDTIRPLENEASRNRVGRARALSSARENTEKYNKSLAGRVESAIRKLKKKKK